MQVIEAKVREIIDENYNTTKTNAFVNSIGRKRKSVTEINVEAELDKKFNMNLIEMKIRELRRKLSLLCLGVSLVNDTKVLI